MISITNSILGLLLTLSNNKHCIRKIQEELDVGVENDRLPEFQDRANTPYVEATVLEAMRYASPEPLMPHWYLSIESPHQSFFLSNARTQHSHLIDGKKSDLQLLVQLKLNETKCMP